jgi:hypothetical protein
MASQAEATEKVFSCIRLGSLILISECKSAIKKRDSLPFFLDRLIDGFIAPKIFPRCGLPEL